MQCHIQGYQKSGFRSEFLMSVWKIYKQNKIKKQTFNLFLVLTCASHDQITSGQSWWIAIHTYHQFLPSQLGLQWPLMLAFRDWKKGCQSLQGLKKIAYVRVISVCCTQINAGRMFHAESPTQSAATYIGSIFSQHIIDFSVCLQSVRTLPVPYSKGRYCKGFVIFGLQSCDPPRTPCR